MQEFETIILKGKVMIDITIVITSSAYPTRTKLRQAYAQSQDLIAVVAGGVR